MKWQQHGELASLPQSAADFDAAVVLFDNTTGEGETQAGSVALCRVKRPEDVGDVLRRDSAAIIADEHGGEAFSRPDLDTHRAGAGDGLHRIQQQIQENLVNLIAIV